jgi:hypothetical protein
MRLRKETTFATFFWLKKNWNEIDKIVFFVWCGETKAIAGANINST